MSSPTLGIVPYLNVLPLLEGLETTFPAENWIRATPRELAGMLANGEIDIAIVSVFEGLRRPDLYRLIPGAAIGSDGAVRSVILYSKVPLREIRSVLLDRASLTSVNLGRLLLTRAHGLRPAMDDSAEPIRPDHDWQRDPHDAFLVIGDVALQWQGRFPHQLDLGEEWKRQTGLPFVFAGWWARTGLELDAGQIEAFSRARVAGLARIPEIVARLDPAMHARMGGAGVIVDYLRNAVSFDLGGRELEALNLYRRQLIEEGLLPRDAGEIRLAQPCGAGAS